MQYALLGFLIILVLVQAFLLWKSHQQWRWFEITAIIVTTILAVIFVFPVAGALKSRAAWHQIKEELDQRLEDAEYKQVELRYGDPNNPLSDDGVLPLAQKLSAIGIEAGRHWRGLRYNGSSFEGQTSIVLSQPAGEAAVEEGADEGAEDADADQAERPLIAQDMVVYGFSEAPALNSDAPIPRHYLGEFSVASSTSNQITLTPTGPLLPMQRNFIEQGNARSWSVYELLPLDGHEPFVAPGSVPDDDNILGRMDEQLINTLLKGTNEETRREYLRDGSRALPDDPPMSRWVKIKFVKNHSIIVDSPDQLGALEGGFFDGSGRAVDSRLKVGENGEVKFSKEQLLIVKEEAAEPLLAEGVAIEIQTYYLRPLNDYRFVLRRIRLRVAELENRTKQLNAEKEVLQNTIDDTVAMLSAYQTDKLKLEQDFNQFEVEHKAIESYNQDLRSASKQMREKLVRLYRSNQTLEKEIEQIQREIQTEVNSLTSSR